jgi:hypothetical protein
MTVVGNRCALAELAAASPTSADARKHVKARMDPILTANGSASLT